MAGAADRSLNKTVTSNQTINNGSRVTDGILDSSLYADGVSCTLQYVEDDLGVVYQDIDYIRVWDFYSDGWT